MRTRLLCMAFALLTAICLVAQNSANERSFSVPVSILQAAIKKLPGGTSGALPVLEGFVVPGSGPLNHYQRPYYESIVRVSATASGGSLVRISTKITAWNRDPAHTGYEVLQSNGRIESDLLDRLQDALVSNSSRQNSSPSDGAKSKAANSEVAKTAAAFKAKADPPPNIDAPVRQLPSLRKMAAMPGHSEAPANPALEQEARSLEDILRNQSHPTNLVAVKQEETPVLQAPRLDAPVLFVANAEDEFEILNVDSNWVYLRISGLSRGYLRRSSVQILDESADQASRQTTAQKIEQPGQPPNGDKNLFVVSSEEVGSFPGQWTPLKGKSVKIISVQLAHSDGHSTTAMDKLRFARAQFKQDVSASSAGVVLIFDSEDGGMVAATLSTLEQWKAGTLPDDAFWKQCYLDPPEIFGSSQ